MSTILCPQSSMDSSHVVEATTMRLKLVSPKSYNQSSPFAGWSLLQSPSYKPIDDYYFNTSYLHDQKSLKLSQKSLEICTESLGSETGSDMSDNDLIFSVPASSLSVTKSPRDRMESKKALSRSLPPPLMTMSGPKLFQVSTHREGGRLIMEAIETDLGNSWLVAERSHGRLLLTCWKNEEVDLDMGNNENDMKKSEKSEEEMERDMKFQRLRRCNEDENGDKGSISYNWEPSCWVAIS